MLTSNSGGMVTRTILSRGSTGEIVEFLQQQLSNFYQLHFNADGVFGDETETLVKRFQNDCNLVIDGIVGVKTWIFIDEIIPLATSLHSVLRLNSRGREVKYLQVRLNGYFGPELVIDGTFGTSTELQVKRFQTISGLTVDGIVGANTWEYINQPHFDI
ncbi:MAG: peptidoglycan-binding domain-containing protein [Thainema sp.]